MEFPGCVTEKNFMLFSKPGQLEQVLCCSKKTPQRIHQLKNPKNYKDQLKPIIPDYLKRFPDYFSTKMDPLFRLFR